MIMEMAGFEEIDAEKPVLARVVDREPKYKTQAVRPPR